MTFQRKTITDQLKRHLAFKAHVLQIMIGPRQVGKTTPIQKFLRSWKSPHLYVTADKVTPPGAEFLVENWKKARDLKGRQPLLVVDEVQKITRWSETVKLLHDEDVRDKKSLRVILLGSSALLIQRGMGESLAGRFQLIQCPHWSFTECHAAFKWTLDQYLFWGGYPGSVPFIKDFTAWRDYVHDTLIETIISRDVPLLYRVDNPALFRQALTVACQHPAEILSLQKMLGQLQEKGSINTLAHYLDILAGAFLVKPISKWSATPIRVKASTPKRIVLNNALVNSLRGVPYASVMADRSFRGRLAENAVGAVLINAREDVFYWNDRNVEVDFIVRRGEQLIAIEVKSGAGGRRSGLNIFAERYPGTKKILVGENGDIALEDFLLKGLPSKTT
jgi:predicted AAA+ superfamily ATPase